MDGWNVDDEDDDNDEEKMSKREREKEIKLQLKTIKDGKNVLFKVNSEL